MLLQGPLFFFAKGLSQQVNASFRTHWSKFEADQAKYCLIHFSFSTQKADKNNCCYKGPSFILAKKLSQQVNASFRTHWSKFEADQAKKQRRITFIRGLLFFAKRLSQQVNVSFQTLWSIFYTWEQLLIPLSFFSQQVNDSIDLHYVKWMT